MNRLKLGIVLETTGLPIRAALEQAAKLAVDGVQIDAVGDIAPDTLTGTGRREFRNLMRSSNLELSALNCPLRRGLDNPENLQPRLEHLRKVMQLAFDLGARKIVAPLPKILEDAKSSKAVTLREALLALAGYGDRTGTQVALECGLDSAEKTRDYLATFDTANLAVNFDPANFLMNGFEPIGAIPILGNRIIHSHARDARMATVSGGAQEVPVGDGDIEWMMYLATLESIDYHGYLVVDRESGQSRFADVTAAVKFLKRFVNPLS